MTVEHSQLLWQTFFAGTMFAAVFISYLLPILIFNWNRRVLEADISNVGEIQQPHHWSNLSSLSSTIRLKKIRLKRFLSYCNCISAGVFLGVCFLNLVPCTEREFNNLIKNFPSITNVFGTFPLGQFTVICGFFLVLFFESLLANCFQSSENTHNKKELTVPVLYLDEESAENRNVLSVDTNEQEELLPSSNTVNHEEIEALPDRSEFSNSSGRNNITNSHHHHHHSHFPSGLFENKNESMFSFFLIMFATSVHSLFEGLALGLQSDIKTAIRLFIGILLHECLVAVAIGLNAVRLQRNNNAVCLKLHMKYAFFFSATIPLGNVLGILLGYTPGNFGQFVSAIFQGFAAGTFIHVTFFELIPEEFLFNQNCDTSDDESTENKLSEYQSNINGGEFNHSNNHQIFHDNSISYENDQSHRDDTNSHVSHHNYKTKLIKVGLLLLGFLIMALVPFIFPE